MSEVPLISTEKQAELLQSSDISRKSDKVEISEATFIGCSADVLLFFAYGRQNFRFL